MKLFKRVAVVLVMLVAVTGVAATPASAHYAHCAVGNVCLWDADGGLHGGVGMISLGGISGMCINLFGSQNDMANSYYNRRSDGKHVQFYEDANCTGRAFPVANTPTPSTGDDASGNFKWGRCCMSTWEVNKVSSVFWNTG